MAQARPKLTGLSEILTFFRQNETPLYFVSPTAYNLLGIDRWVRNFEYINYYDSFDRYHPRVFVPQENAPRDFRSMEEIGNCLLGHKEVIDRIHRRGPGGKVILVMFDEETEELARELGVEIALPSAALRKRIDSKIVTTQLGNEAGVASVPNVLGCANSYAELRSLSTEAKLGEDLVVQAAYGDSGRTTFFIRNEQDWDTYARELADQELKIMKRINHMPGTLEACVTRYGTLVGPLMMDVTGYAELTPYKGGWCGDDVCHSPLLDKNQQPIHTMAQALGKRLSQEGYRGVFCLDFLLDTDTGEAYLGEINPRVSGASPLTNLITATYGGVPLFLFHLLEFMDVDYQVDLEKIQAHWADFAPWSQLILKQTGDAVELITRAPTSGIWRMNDDGGISFVRRERDWHNVTEEHEAFYMRVYGAGEYRYHGCDLGILVAPGRVQTDDRALLEQARAWAANIIAQFQSIPPAPEMPVVPPEPTIYKMF
jgi:biotin carboxylase